MKELLIKISLHVFRNQYKDRSQRQKEGIAIAKANNKFKGRKANNQLHRMIIEFRSSGKSINKTAELLNCSVATVKNVWAKYRESKEESDNLSLTILKQ
ncbi:helix-turn-helix domain-containing protein [Orbus wheelerorum]|uniref:helix-turn-helix domain-containing protein n=1 Tax=Orbus wheelerorum TaxID=3074111 RepID=UPI00370D312E